MICGNPKTGSRLLLITSDKEHWRATTSDPSAWCDILNQDTSFQKETVHARVRNSSTGENTQRHRSYKSYNQLTESLPMEIVTHSFTESKTGISRQNVGHMICSPPCTSKKREASPHALDIGSNVQVPVAHSQLSMNTVSPCHQFLRLRSSVHHPFTYCFR